MSYPTYDTDWTISAKGNDWRRLNGKLLVVGKNKTGGYWAMVNGDFLPEKFPKKSAAMDAARVAALPKLHDDWSWE